MRCRGCLPRLRQMVRHYTNRLNVGHRRNVGQPENASGRDCLARVAGVGGRCLARLHRNRPVPKYALFCHLGRRKRPKCVLRIKQIGGLLCAKILHRCPAFGKTRQLGNGHGLGEADGVVVQNFAVQPCVVQRGEVLLGVGMAAVHAQSERRIGLEGGCDVLPMFGVLFLNFFFLF